MAHGVDIAIAIKTTVNKIIDRLRLPKAFIVVCTNFLFYTDALLN
jgi:hypothetical protein